MQVINDIYHPPWCRAGPYFVGVLLGFLLFRINGKLKMHPVGTSLFAARVQTLGHVKAIEKKSKKPALNLISVYHVSNN